ncbi:hypothetical protein M3I54_30005 [Paraburkholderia sp. CNPSo 3274]|uniref:hypothetical protein n=1 Tax=Paraburkholderia sp. CNPSo 3274 TaxID=2940932 RepID=UPI0020B71D9B|nr:hypothetical protein [Paraburkholderia sp. CNPSo 3274]MCP3711159.1 hypothetical protein [Paraburkholderia sp. CNPSo 3274]
MRQTVLGIYDSYGSARSAQKALGDAGVAQADIAIYSMSVEAAVETGPRVYAPGASDAGQHAPVFDQLERLFARLFTHGAYPPETEDYREFIRRGGTVVSADVSEMQVNLAREVMRSAGAADIEERSSAWHNASSGIAPSRSTARAPGNFHETSPEAAAETRYATFSSAVPTVVTGMQQVTTRAATEPERTSSAAKTQRTSARGLVGDPVMGTPIDEASYETDVRKDYDANYANSGMSYEEYCAAYEHGATLGQDERYRGHDWQGIEPSAREDWESRYPENGWERFKAAVRHGWERMKGV